MAKINHNDFNNTVNDIVSQAKQRNIIHLESLGKTWKGKEFNIKNKTLVNFGTSGYLGLETHPKLIQSSKDFIEHYGTQFSISRAYVNSSQIRVLEEKLSAIYDNYKTVVFSSTTLAHIAAVPLIMSPNDAIIVDQQAHVSMQTAIQLMSNKGATVTMIRHSSIEMLERKLKELTNKHQKIWYVIDGVYSMYGDLAPYEDLKVLSEKYPQLHFYIDDAHGMSWTGSKGSGSAFNFFKETHKTILVGTMAKGFGSIGGVVVFPNDEIHKKVTMHGGPLAYSHPIPPSIIGASIASADIHVSNEINELQKEHSDKMKYCNQLLGETDLPIISTHQSPIYFIGTGQPKVGFNFNKRIINDGFYVNLGLFPAVSMKNTGLRFTITNHVSKDNIKDFVETLVYHYPKAIQEEGRTKNQVRKAFKLPLLEEDTIKEIPEEIVNLELEKFNTIEKIDKETWNTLMKERPNCSWESLKMSEDSYNKNSRKEENAEMLYYLVKDKKGEIICATMFTYLLLKDDMFEQENKSKIIESKRTENPYYMASKKFIMGTMISSGDHIYYKNEEENLKALEVILEDLQKELNERGGNGIILRDFNEDNSKLDNYFYDYGYTKIKMPNFNNIELELPFREESILNNLSKSSKKNFKRYIKNREENFDVDIKPELTDDEIKLFWDMQENIRKRNFSINVFQYPIKIIKEMSNNEEYEFILLKNKSASEYMAIGCCHKSVNIYAPVLLGMSDEGLGNKIYHQMLYQAVKRAGLLNLKYVYLGLSADEAKKDVGAIQVPKAGYIYIKDNFNLEAIEAISA